MYFNNKTLAAQGFFPLQQGEESGEEARFFKPYEAVSLIIIFDKITGELFGFNLSGEEAVVRFMVGELVVVDHSNTLPIQYLTEVQRIAPVNLCQLINVHRIVSLEQFKAAVNAFEKIIELQLMAPYRKFTIGERVRYTNAETDSFGMIEDINYEKYGSDSLLYYRIRLSNGRIVSTCLEGNIKKSMQTRRFMAFHNNLKFAIP